MGVQINTKEQSLKILNNLSRAMIMGYPFEQELNQIDQVIAFIEQQEQYVELGRLAVETISKKKSLLLTSGICRSFPGETDVTHCGSCEWYKFCAKRAELEGGNGSEL